MERSKSLFIVIWVFYFHTLIVWIVTVRQAKPKLSLSIGLSLGFLFFYRYIGSNGMGDEHGWIFSH